MDIRCWRQEEEFFSHGGTGGTEGTGCVDSFGLGLNRFAVSVFVSIY